MLYQDGFFSTSLVAIYISATEIPTNRPQSLHPIIDRSCHINDGDPDINPYLKAFIIRLVHLRDICDQCSPMAH